MIILSGKKILNIRMDVNKALEKARDEGVIGGALDASVIIHAKQDTFDLLNKIAAELRFLFLTSDVKVYLAEIESIEILASEAAKCIRCWQKREEIGHNSQHPEICDRCIENVDGAGEQRLYV